jgi:hypothetical protein
MKDRKEIQYLKEIVDLQSQLIAELRQRPTLMTSGVLPFVNNCPSVWQVRCTDMCDYGLADTSGMQKYCKKCGQPQISNPHITVTSAVQGLPHVP